MAGTKETKKAADDSNPTAPEAQPGTSPTSSATAGDDAGIEGAGGASAAKSKGADTRELQVRIATVHPAASDCILVGTTAVLFATGNVDGARGRISEPVDQATADALLSNPIFRPLSLTAEEAAQVDEALERVRRNQSASVAAVDDRDRTIEELRDANRNMAAALDSARKRIAELEAASGK